MKRFVFILISLLLMTPVAADAAGNRLLTNNLSVKNERLFEVEVAFSGSVLTAGTFTLTYDADAVDYREVTSDIEGALFSTQNENGRTTVVFLCGAGLRTDNSPVLFRVKYKLVGGRDTSVRISANDCTGSDAAHIQTPEDAVCEIGLISDESGSARSRSKPSVKSERSSYYSGKSIDSRDSVDDKSPRSREIYVESKDNAQAFLNTVFLTVAVIGATVAVIFFMRTDRKKDEDKKR